MYPERQHLSKTHYDKSRQIQEWFAKASSFVHCIFHSLDDLVLIN